MVAEEGISVHIVAGWESSNQNKPEGPKRTPWKYRFPLSCERREHPEQTHKVGEGRRKEIEKVQLFEKWCPTILPRLALNHLLAQAILLP